MKSSILVNIDVKDLLKRRDPKLVAPFIIWKLQQAGMPLMDWMPGERHMVKDMAMTGVVMQVVSMGNKPRYSGGRETTGVLRYFWMEGNPSNKELFEGLRQALREKDGMTHPPPSRTGEGKGERNS